MLIIVSFTLLQEEVDYAQQIIAAVFSEDCNYGER